MFSFKVALRFLLSNKTQTLLIALGIAVGVSVQVFIGSLIQGLQASLIDSTIGSSSHITISAEARDAYLDYDDDIYTLLTEIDQDITAVSPVLEGSGTIISEDTSDPVVIRGFDYDKAEAIYQFDDRLVDGVLPSDVNHVVLGLDLVQALDLVVGDTLEIIIPTFDQPVTVTLVGIFDFSVTSINNSWMLMSLEGAQSILDVQGISKYEMQIGEVFNSVTISETIDNNLFSTYKVTEWQSSNAELLSGLEGQSVSSLMIQIFVMISVVLGISSVLAITVLQKSKQLGILKAMGTNDRQAALIFLFEGALLGFIGATLGILLGLGLLYSFTAFTDVIPILINPLFIAGSAFIALLACIIAALIPARRSGRLSVIEVIRNG